MVEEEGVGETMNEEQVGLLPLGSPSLYPSVQPVPDPRLATPSQMSRPGSERWVGVSTSRV